MNRALFILIISVASLFYIFKMDRPITERFTFMNNFKEFYVRKSNEVSEFIDQYLNQANTIESLREENDALRKYQILYTKANTSLTLLQNAIFKHPDESIQLKMSNVLSYVEFDD